MSNEIENDWYLQHHRYKYKLRKEYQGSYDDVYDIWEDLNQVWVEIRIGAQRDHEYHK